MIIIPAELQQKSAPLAKGGRLLGVGLSAHECAKHHMDMPEPLGWYLENGIVYAQSR